MLDLEADEGRAGSRRAASSGIFMTAGKATSGRAHPPQDGHGAGRSNSSEPKAVDHVADLQRALSCSIPAQRRMLSNMRQAGGADLSRGGRVVVGHAHIGQRIARVVEQRVAGGGIVIARLADRADHGEPLPARQQRDLRRPETGIKWPGLSPERR